jgi:hypothetical protein
MIEEATDKSFTALGNLDGDMTTSHTATTPSTTASVLT